MLINSALFSEVYKNNELNSLAVLSLLTDEYQHRRIFFRHKKTEVYKEIANKIGISEKTFRGHIKTLKKYGVIVEFKHCLKILSQKEIRSIYKTYAVLSFKQNNYRDLKHALKTRVLVSRLNKQFKKRERKEDLKEKILKIELNHRIPAKEYRSVKKYLRNGQDLNFSPELKIANKTILEHINKKSLSTSCKWKKIIQKLYPIKFYRRYDEIYTNVTKSDFFHLRDNDMIPAYSKFRGSTDDSGVTTGKIIVDISCGVYFLDKKPTNSYKKFQWILDNIDKFPRNTKKSPFRANPKILVRKSNPQSLTFESNKFNSKV